MVFLFYRIKVLIKNFHEFFHSLHGCEGFGKLFIGGHGDRLKNERCCDIVVEGDRGGGSGKLRGEGFERRCVNGSTSARAHDPVCVP